MRGRSNKTLIAGIIIVIVVIALFMFYVFTRPNGQIWGERKEYNQNQNFPTIAIKCEYGSIDENDFLDENEFVETDSLKRIYFYVLDYTADIDIESIEIIPPGEKLGETYIVGELGENPPYPNGYYVKNIGADNPIQLNQEGFWRIQLNLNESTAVYRYDGSTDTFSDSSVVKFLEDEITTFRVLTTSDVERRIGEEESPWDIFISNLGFIATLIIGGLTLFILLITYISKRRKEKKPTIINVITNVIDNDVAKELDWLNNTTIQGLEEDRIRNVPDFISRVKLNEPRWKDFEDEYKGMCDKLGEYVELKNQYKRVYKQLDERIKSALTDLISHDSPINTRIQEIRDGRNESHVPLDEYYRTQFEQEFVRAIRENENCLNQRRRPYSVFAQFQDELLAIRDNPQVYTRIETLIELLDDLRKASTLLDDIRTNKRVRLRRKYHISNDELGNNNS